MKRAQMLGGTSLSVAAAAIGAPNPSLSEGLANPADAALDAFFTAQWSHALTRSPETASYQGDRSGDDRWDDVSLTAQAADLSYSRQALAQLEKFDRNTFGSSSRLNFDLYRAQLLDTIRGLELQTYLFALNQRSGVQSDSTIVDVLPFAAVANYEALLTRLQSWPRKVDQTIEVLGAAVAAKRLWPHVVMVRVPAQLDRLDVAPEQHPFFAPFTHLSATIPGGIAQQLRTAAVKVIGESILPAQRRLKRFLTETYLPAAPSAVGLLHVPNGDALYAYYLRTNTTTDLTPQHVHALGLEQVAQIRSAMEATARTTGYPGGLHDVFAAMRRDPQNFYADGRQLLEGYRALAKRIDPELVRLFDPLPRQPYGVVALPAAFAPDATTAYYQPGSLDGRRAGAMNCNLYEPGSRPIYEMPVLTLHESVPGHHLQFALGSELGALPNFRRIAYYVGYSEGWGLYAESLGHEIGVYDNPRVLLGAQAYDMWRAVRLVVDTGMHAFGWSRERAITYFLDNAPKTKLDVVNEIDRYITDPGQACAYKLGQLKIVELRDRARARLGSAFDIRAFHAVVLGAGSIPLHVLETRVDDWIMAT